MRILNEGNGELIKSVMIMLTEKEAKELSTGIASINPNEGEHIHVNDLGYKWQVTVLIYNPENLQFFNKVVQKIIGDGKD